MEELEILNLNLDHFRRLLELQTDPVRRQTIQTLIRETETELAVIAARGRTAAGVDLRQPKAQPPIRGAGADGNRGERRAAAHRTGAFGQLIEAQLPRLRRYARALVGEAARADDLVRASLARARAHRHDWHEGHDLRVWLFAQLHLQRAGIGDGGCENGRAETSLAEPLPARAPPQEGRLELRDLDRALGRLSEEQRSVILLVGLEGMRHREVADALNVAVGTVRSRLWRGRRSLRALIADGAGKKVPGPRSPTRGV